MAGLLAGRVLRSASKSKGLISSFHDGASQVCFCGIPRATSMLCVRWLRVLCSTHFPMCLDYLPVPLPGTNQDKAAIHSLVLGRLSF